MRNRALAVIGTAVLLALSGCTTPEPATPTPTAAFSSEEEAFAAAEETYRAYVDALNASHDDPNAAPAPTDFLIGEALESELETQETLAQRSLNIEGPATVMRFSGTSTSDEMERITAVVCLDVTMSRVIDAESNDVTPTDRPDVLALDVEFADLGGDLAITRSVVASTQTC